MTTLGLNFSQHGQLICEEDERKMKITWGGGRFFPFQIAFPPTMTTTACNLHAHVDCIAAHLLLLSPYSRQNSRAVCIRCERMGGLTHVWRHLPHCWRCSRRRSQRIRRERMGASRCENLSGKFCDTQLLQHPREL